jgi:excisionase family DNA binding protein
VLPPDLGDATPAMDNRAAPWTADSGPDAGDAEWLSASAAAALLGISQRTIRRAISRGDLPATKRAGVYRIALVDAFCYQARRRVAIQPQTPIQRDEPRLLPFPDREPAPALPSRAPSSSGASATSSPSARCFSAPTCRS